MATRCRSASTGWSTSPGRDVVEGDGTRRRAGWASARCCAGSVTSSPTSASRRSGSSRPKGWSSRSAAPPGYRKFSHADVDQLRYVLAAQRDHYLPLRVIKEHLDAIARGLEPPSVAGESPRAPRPRTTADSAGRGLGPGRDPAVALRAARQLGAHREPADGPAGVRPGPAGRRQRALRPGRADDRLDGGRRWRGTGWSHGTCGRSRPPPTGRPG